MCDCERACERAGRVFYHRAASGAECQAFASGCGRRRSLPVEDARGRGADGARRNAEPRQHGATCLSQRANNAPDNVRPDNVRPDNVRPDNVRPVNVRPDNVRPDNVRQTTCGRQRVADNAPDNVRPDNVQPDNVRPDNVRQTTCGQTTCGQAGVAAVVARGCRISVCVRCVRLGVSSTCNACTCPQRTVPHAHTRA